MEMFHSIVSPAALVTSYPITPRSKTISTVYPTSTAASLLVVPLTTVRASHAAIWAAVRGTTWPVAQSHTGSGAQRPLKIGGLATAESIAWAQGHTVFASRGYHHE